MDLISSISHRLWHIWSQTHTVHGHLVPHNWSPIDWSLWTNGPQPILSPWSYGPQKFGPHGQMVRNQFGSPGQMVPKIFCLSRVTGYDDLVIWWPNWLGTICPRGPNFCGPFVQGDRIWLGPSVQGDQFYGDRLSRGTGSPGIKLVGDQMRRSLKKGLAPLSRGSWTSSSIARQHRRRIERETLHGRLRCTLF